MPLYSSSRWQHAVMGGSVSRSSCWTTASSFRQPPSTRCSTVSARYVRPSHLRCRWTNNMELVPNIDCFCRTLKTCLFERIRGAFCDDALYKLTFTLGVICCRSTQTVWVLSCMASFVWCFNFCERYYILVSCWSRRCLKWSRCTVLSGCAFLVFSTRLCAQNAVRTMHHSRVLDVRTVFVLRSRRRSSIVSR